MVALAKEHSAAFAALLISVIATGYALVDGTVSKELFILYGVQATGLYGISQQSRISQYNISPGKQKEDL